MRHSTMMRLAAVAVAGLLLAACGGGNDTAGEDAATSAPPDAGQPQDDESGDGGDVTGTEMDEWTVDGNGFFDLAKLQERLMQMGDMAPDQRQRLTQTVGKVTGSTVHHWNENGKHPCAGRAVEAWAAGESVPQTVYMAALLQLGLAHSDAVSMVECFDTGGKGALTFDEFTIMARQVGLHTFMQLRHGHR